MTYGTINMHKAIELFHNLINTQNKSKPNMLHLYGESKTGKSHLLTEVFPRIAVEHYQAPFTVLDPRYHVLTIPHYLHQFCSDLGGQPFSYTRYEKAYEAWIERSSEVKVENHLAFLSRLTISNQGNNEGLSQRDLDLTTKFVKDLNEQDDKPVIFLFDSIDQSSPYIKTWIIHTLLVQLCKLPHVRIVIAGCDIQELNIKYARDCPSYRLSAVLEIDAYIAFCHAAHISLSEGEIKTLARVFKHSPGLFVEWVVPTFSEHES